MRPPELSLPRPGLRPCRAEPGSYRRHGGSWRTRRTAGNPPAAQSHDAPAPAGVSRAQPRTQTYLKRQRYVTHHTGTKKARSPITGEFLTSDRQWHSWTEQPILYVRDSAGVSTVGHRPGRIGAARSSTKRANCSGTEDLNRPRAGLPVLNRGVTGQGGLGGDVSCSTSTGTVAWPDAVNSRFHTVDTGGGKRRIGRELVSRRQVRASQQLPPV